MSPRLLAFLAFSSLFAVSSIAIAQPKSDPKPAEPAKAPAKEDKKPDAKPATDASPKGDGKDAAKDAVKDGTKADKKDEVKTPPTRAIADPAVLVFKVKDIDGKEVDLASFKGKVVLIVNVASKCGFTKQYAGLEKLYKDKKDQGLVILGFPCNDFNGQEPGSESEIKAFCTKEYGVTFPMFSKVRIKEDKSAKEPVHPLYAKLAAQRDPVGGEPKWNFTKYLVNRKGDVVARFDPKDKPSDEAFVKRVEELLGEK